MAFGRNQRIDGRRSSSYCSTATLIVFVALCLVGAWMMTSSTVAPLELSSSGKSKVISEMAGTHSNGDPVATKTTSEAFKDQTSLENSENRSADPTEGEKEDSADSSDGSKDTFFGGNSEEKSPTYSDESGTGEGGEVAKIDEGVTAEGGVSDTGGEKSQQGGIDTTTTEQNESKEQQDSEQRSLEHESNEMEGNEDNKSTKSQLKQSYIGKNSSENISDDQQLESKRSSRDDSSDEQHKSDDMTSSTQVEKKEDVEAAEVDKEQSVLPDGAQSDLLNETNAQNGAWSTQATESKNEKEVQASSSSEKQYSWTLCNVTAGADYIPCLDNEQAVRKLPSTKHYEHRERHCPEEAPNCIVPLPKGYRKSIEWPTSRDKIWYFNVPHTKLAVVKGHQNWVKVSGEHLIFPGGGTQFKNGALHYIDFIQELMPEIAWGKKSRVVLDVGCGVASFGGYLFDRDTLTMSFAPKDEHEAQVQFALERGIPAISAVMGTSRLPFPSGVFDVIHCARCRVPWYAEGGMLLLELNRLLRPGGFFVWSATPVYRKVQEDKEIWNAMSDLTKSMCWKRVAKNMDELNEVGVAIYRKPLNNTCYEKRKQNTPPICQDSDDPNAAWNIRLQACMHKLPADSAVRGSHWPYDWPLRLEKSPYWLNNSQAGVYGRPAPEDFEQDYKHWKKVVTNSYLNGMGIDWSTVRNVMDMRSVYGGFAAALRDMKVWVMNVVSIDSPDTLPIIYERGLFGIYHDWCESFSSYPRTYDLLHADHIFSITKKRCNMLPVFVEVDRLLRPGGKLIVRDTKEVITELVGLAKSLNWEIRMTFAKESQGLLVAQKTMRRPEEVVEATSSSTEAQLQV